MTYSHPLAVTPYLSKLYKEVDTALEVDITGFVFKAGVLTTSFVETLSAEDETTLNGVVAAHDPTKEPVRQLIAPATLIRQEVSVANETEWEGMAGVIAAPDFFAPGERLQNVIGHVLGQFFCVGGGAEIRLTEDVYGMGQAYSGITADYNAPETGGTWQILSFFTNRPPLNGANLYQLEARRNGAADLKIRNTSMALYELIT